MLVGRIISILILLCLAAMVGLVAYILLVPRPAGWTNHLLHDRTTGSITYDFRVGALEGGSFLSMTCKPSRPIRTLLIVDRSAYEGADDAVRQAVVRFDDDPPQHYPVTIEGRVAAFNASSEADAKQFVSRLASSRRVAIELPGAKGEVGEGRLLVEFPTIGADDVVADLRKTCL